MYLAASIILALSIMVFFGAMHFRHIVAYNGVVMAGLGGLWRRPFCLAPLLYQRSANPDEPARIFEASYPSKRS